MTIQMPPLQTMEYYDLGDFNKDLLSKGWTHDEIYALQELQANPSNGEIVTFYLDDKDEILHQKLIAAGYPPRFNIFWWW